MPLKSGSSDEVVQENIKNILAHDGSAGYDPPYLDPSKEEYTPAQAAAIAYAKAGRRNNAGKNPGNPDKTYKAPKNDKLQDGNLKWWREMGVKVPGVKPKDAESETDEEIQAKKPKDYVPKAPQKPLNPKLAWPKDKKPQKKDGEEKDKTLKDQKAPEQKPKQSIKAPRNPNLPKKEDNDGNDKNPATPSAQIPEGWKVKDQDQNQGKQTPPSLPKDGEGSQIQVPDGWNVKDQGQDQNQDQGQDQSLRTTDQFGFKVPELDSSYNVKREFLNPKATTEAAGAMGTVKFSQDGKIALKKGKIGQYEALAIKKLEGTGVVPKLLGAIIEGKGKTVEAGLGAHVKEAPGYIAMERMKGKPAAIYVHGFYGEKLTPEELANLSNEYYKVRSQIHTNGVAHNDMHMKNFFYDKDSGKGGLIDLGLAQISYRAALIEATGSFTDKDWQAGRVNLFLTKTPEMQKLEGNIRKVQNEIKAKYGGYIKADIRTPESEFDEKWGVYGMSEDEAKAYVNKIYDGVFS